MTWSATPRSRSFSMTSRSLGCGIVLCLAFEIPDPVIGNEKRSDRTIGVVRHKPATFCIELGAPALTLYFQDGLVRPGVPQLLRHSQVLVLRDVSKLRAVFGVVFLQQVMRTEAWSAGQK